MGMNANSTGALLDLYEILDIHEEGMAFQSASPMEPGESFSLCLDLTQPATYIHTSGRVVWSDPSGRTGLRFHKMPAADLGRFQQWLSGEAVSHDQTVGEGVKANGAPVAHAEGASGAQAELNEDEGRLLGLHPVNPNGSGLHVVSSTKFDFGQPAVTELDDEPGFAQPGYVERGFDRPAFVELVFTRRDSSTRGSSKPAFSTGSSAPVLAEPDVEAGFVEPASTDRSRDQAAEEVSPAGVKLNQPHPVEPGGSEPDQKESISAPAVLDEHEHGSAAAATAEVGREIENYSLDLDAALQIIAERTLTLTGASGTAIALLTGEQMICRASAGQDAPPLGARLQTGSGFSGECIRTGSLLYCEDSETDPIVDRESCRALGVRSILAAPIHSPHGVVGLVEVFSPRPCAFGEQDEIILQSLARITFEAAERTVQSLPVDQPADAKSEHAGGAVGAAGVSEPTAVSDPMADFSGEDIFPSDGPGERMRPWRKPRLPVIAGIVMVLLMLACLVLLKSHSRLTAQAAQAPQVAARSNSRTQAQIASTDDLRKLAMAGDPDAQYELGVRYAVGADMPQDYDQAAHWFLAAAEQGHIMAESNLGAYYWAGRGVPKDLNRAYFWALLAQAGGDEASRVRVPFLASRLSPSEILTDQQQADEWFRNHRPHGKPSPAK